MAKRRYSSHVGRNVRRAVRRHAIQHKLEKLRRQADWFSILGWAFVIVACTWLLIR